MAGYKDEEIEAEVSRFVQSNIRIDKDPLGPVDVGSKFNEVLQLISSTLVYDPNAIFYIIYLATNRLNVSVETAIEYVEDLDEAINEMGYRTEDISRTTLLGDAAAALLTVDQILSDKNAISSRAFTRYQQAVDTFIEVSLEPNIKQRGDIVRPPQLARQSALTLLSTLSALYSSILSTLAQIRLMLSEFNALNLGVVNIQSSVQKVRADLRTLQTQFESTTTTRDDKIALCRGAYLNLASGKSVLNNFTTVTDPSDARLVSSSSISGSPAVPTSDGELVPATLTGTVSAPWEVETGASDTLKVTNDSTSEKTYTFVPPEQPSVISAERADFNIVAGTNDLFEVDGLAISLGVGLLTHSEVVQDINDSLTGKPYLAEVYDTDYIRITKTAAGATEIRITAENGDAGIIANTLEAVGFYEGQADSSDGFSAAEAADQINAAGDMEAEVVQTLYESGDSTGTIASTTSMTLPSGTLSATDHGHVGDILLIRSGVNAGYHRITSVVLGVDTVNVSSDTPFKVTATTESWIILSENLKISSISAGLATKLAMGTANAHSVLGFTDAETVAGTTTGFRATEDGTDVDFSHLDIVVGDIVRVAHTEGITSIATEHTVTALADSNGQLELTPPLGTDWTIDSFRILSTAAVSYETLVAALSDWDELLAASEFEEDILELERLMNPLIANKNPAAAQLNDASNKLQSLKELLTNTSPDGLTEILQAYRVSIVPRVDAALKMLKERGLDRAYDLLMDGEISTFFGMDKDDASTSAYILKTMRSVVQADLPLSKLDEDADDLILTDSVGWTDPDYDYSDADADENVRLLGEVPDFDDEDDESLTSRARY